jgi:hypothetical protein
LDIALSKQDKKGEDIASRKVNCLSTQLEISNPILTSISDAMTAGTMSFVLETLCGIFFSRIFIFCYCCWTWWFLSDILEAEAIDRFAKEQNLEEKEKINKEIEAFRSKKEDGQRNLMTVSEKYKQEMIEIRLDASRI